MNRPAIVGVNALLAVALLLGGCTRTQQGAVIGGASGAGLGAVIGNQSGHAGEGAVVGALAGTLLGGLVGAGMDEHEKNTRVRSGPYTRHEQAYPPAPSRTLDVVNMEVSPRNVLPGERVEMLVRDRVLLPRDSQRTMIEEETRVFLPNDEVRVFERNQYDVQSGTYEMSRFIHIHQESPRGTYRVQTRLISNGQVQQVDERTFQVG